MRALIPLCISLALMGCQQESAPEPPAMESAETTQSSTSADTSMASNDHKLLVPHARLDIYASVPLTADIDHLNEQQRQMLELLIEASAPLCVSTKSVNPSSPAIVTL